MKTVTLVRNLFLGFFVTMFVFFAAVQSASALTASFTWKMHERFGLNKYCTQPDLIKYCGLPDPNECCTQVDLDGNAAWFENPPTPGMIIDPNYLMVDYHWDTVNERYKSDYVFPEPDKWAVDFDASASAGTTVYTWYIDDVSQGSGGPTPTIPIQTLGSHKVTLTVTDGAATESITKFIYLKDWVIVSLGDSYASGEGNPDIPGSFGGEMWQDARAHRSAYAGPARAAIEIERADPHSSVTFLSFAGTGALIPNLIDTKYAGAGYNGDITQKIKEDWDSWYPDAPPQLIQLERTLCSSPDPEVVDKCNSNTRKIDALTLSIGGNDSGFGDVIMRSIFPNTNTGECVFSGINCPLMTTPIGIPLWFGIDDDFSQRDTDVTLPVFGVPVTLRALDLSEKFRYLPGWYQGLEAAIKEKLGDSASEIYVTEYPDPTHDENGHPCQSLLAPYFAPGGVPILDYWMSQAEYGWIFNNFFDPLKNTIKYAVGEINKDPNNADLPWKYVGGIADASYYHGMSASNTWFQDITLAIMEEFDPHGAFHPNIKGHIDYQDGILARMLPLLDPIPGSDKPVEIPEGSQYATDVTVVDVQTPLMQPYRTWDITVDYGDNTSDQWTSMVTNQESNTEEKEIAHTYASPGYYNVNVTITADNGNVRTTQATVHVVNVPPTVGAILGATIDEGETYKAFGSFSDPGLDTWTATVDYGDGSGVQTLPLDPDKTFSLSHAYGDNGSYSVLVTVTDNFGGVGTSTVTVTVRNVAPSAHITSIQQPYPGFILPRVHTLMYSGTFTDPGWLDTHTSVWAFGDGLTATGSLTEEHNPPDSTGSVGTTHAYDQPGTYAVTLTVADDDGGKGNDTKTVRVISAADAVNILNQLIQSLPNSDFTQNAKQQKNALEQKLALIISYINAGDYQSAKHSLISDVRTKVDGLVDGSTNSDWINDATAQRQICAMIDQIVTYLNTL